MSRAYTAKAIREALGVTQQAVDKRIRGRRDRTGKQIEAPWVPCGKEGKALLFAYEALPEDVREALDVQAAREARRAEIAQREAGLPVATEAAPVPAPVLDAPRRFVTRTDWTPEDHEVANAKMVMVGAIHELQIEQDVKVKAACQTLAGRVLDHAVTPEFERAYHATRDKVREGEQSPGAVTRHLQRIHTHYLQGVREDDPLKYLVPLKIEKKGHNPTHLKALLMFWGNPHQPTVKQVYKKMAPWLQERGITPPVYATVAKMVRGLPVRLKYRGRVTGSALKALLPYVKRDVSMFRANDFWVGDGHSFKAKVQSPIHGNAFVPEVTAIIDWVSRKVVGWSVALSESTIAVSDAFRDAQTRTTARPLIYYSDNGAGQTGKHIDHELTGTLARQGIGHETGIPGNPQGRGVIERWWPTVLIPLAATYPSFTGKRADKETVRKIGNEVARAQRAGEDTPLLPTFQQFLADLEAAIDDYNANHRHRELGGMTPNEAYAAKLDPESVGIVSRDELAQLWMPEEIRTPTRGLIQLFNNAYFLPSLVDELAEREKVRVRFDIHDGRQVQVFRMDGRPLGVAEWNGHQREAWPVPYIEQKREKRVAGIRKRGEETIARADSELLQTLEGEVIPPLDILQALSAAELAELEARQPQQEVQADFAQTFFQAPDEAQDEAPSDPLPDTGFSPELPEEVTPPSPTRQYKDPSDVALYFFGAQLDEADAEAEKKNAAD